MFEQPQQHHEMEPVVLIDKSRNKEAHVIVPLHYSFADMIATAKRINPDMFDGAWQLSYLNKQTQRAELVAQDTTIGAFIAQGIDTFYWNYSKPSFKLPLPSDQKSKGTWQTNQREAVYGKREWFEQQQSHSDGFGLPRQDGGGRSYTIQYADIAKRFIAFLIDIFILMIILGATKSGMSFFIWWLYYAVMESSNMQGTFGKMAMGLKVTTLSGKKLNFGQATARYFLKWLSNMTLGIGYLMPLFTEKRQTLHDLLSGSLVVEKTK